MSAINSVIDSEKNATLFLAGDLDIFTIEEVIKEIDKQTKRTCFLNFNSVTFMDSSGIGLLLRKAMEWNEKGRTLTFTGIPASIYEVLEEMGIIEILDEINRGQSIA